MAGVGGKTYEIWTREEADKFIEKVYRYVKNNPGCYTMGEAAVESGEYEAVIWYLQGKFKIEFDSIKTAKDILKARCLKLGMDGKTNATMTIFNLVNNFDMINTNTKSDITTKGKAINNFPIDKLSDEALKEIANLSGTGESGIE